MPPKDQMEVIKTTRRGSRWTTAATDDVRAVPNEVEPLRPELLRPCASRAAHTESGASPGFNFGKVQEKASGNSRLRLERTGPKRVDGIGAEAAQVRVGFWSAGSLALSVRREDDGHGRNVQLHRDR